MAYKLLSQITKTDPHKKTEQWTAKIIVAEKCSPKLSQNAVRYQQLLLMDIKGNTVRASIYERHIPPLAHTLKLGRTYLISNANVKKASPFHRKFIGELNWTITGGCNVVDTDEDHYDLLSTRIKLTPFTGLVELKNRNIPTTVIGMVIATGPLRPGPSKTGQEYMIHDISVMDQSFETANLRMYTSYAENEGHEIAITIEQIPVIIAKHVFVTTFEGIGLSTTHDTCIYVNTPFKEVLAYQKWIEENQATIAEVKALRKYLTLKKIEPAAEEIPSPIKDTAEMPIKNHCWVKATAMVKPTGTPYWYMSCSTCYTASSETMASRNFNCRYCSDIDAKAIPRAHADVELSDNTYTLTASMIGRPAEEFLGASASKLITKAAMDLQQNIRLNIADDHLFYVKAVMGRPSSSDHGYPTKKFEIVALTECNNIREHEILLQTIGAHIHTPDPSTKPYGTTDITGSTPTMKRSLFQEDAPQTSKKKVHSKLD